MSDALFIFQAQGIRFSSLTADSRQVKQGSLFLAYPGETHDGRNFIDQAVSQGAAAVIWEHEGFTWNEEWNVPNLPVKGLREHSGSIASRFFGQPSEHLWMIGVTGTNGKTSCSHWIAQTLTQLGRKTALVGTLGNGFPGALSHAINTTPDPILLHGLLAEYLQQGAQAVAMEVSSHGLDQGRVGGVHFDVAVLTNLSRDHLDYHGDMSAYAASKRRLFDWPRLAVCVLNIDDEFGCSIAGELTANGRKVLTYGFASTAMVRGYNLNRTTKGLSMQIVTENEDISVAAPVVGDFNASNILAVFATLMASGFQPHEAAQAISEIRPVPGRMQQMGGGAQPLVVIDYAHTPDALEKVLLALKAHASGRLYCVFGCGGNRDKGKRPLMGEVASRLADKVFITSDNPRDESPVDIISAIVSGVDGRYDVVPDRTQAITTAIHQAKSGDVILIAGKGHEEYQEIAGVKHPYSDLEVASRQLKEWQP
jgi:UDP-N-acetylmuramoyl-L-alanyl-D-glutamate--2,6-diaminopimelate ligase